MIIEVPYFKYINNYKIFKMKHRKLLTKHNIDLKVYDGLANSPWNGGRTPNQDLPIKGINVSFAITAHSVDDFEHLESHNLLNTYNIKGNSIIIANLELLEKLKVLYKNYTYIYSITAFDINKGFDKYKLIEPLVDYIVPRTELIDSDEFYNLNTEQYILLFSYECAYCPLYLDHYKEIGKNVLNPDKQYLTMCWFKDKSLFDDLEFNAEDYDYEYKTSNNFHHKLLDIDPKILGGYKIGRNQQSFEKIEDELKEILGVINENGIKI